MLWRRAGSSALASWEFRLLGRRVDRGGRCGWPRWDAGECWGAACVRCGGAGGAGWRRVDCGSKKRVAAASGPDDEEREPGLWLDNHAHLTRKRQGCASGCNWKRSLQQDERVTAKLLLREAWVWGAPRPSVLFPTTVNRRRNRGKRGKTAARAAEHPAPSLPLKASLSKSPSQSLPLKVSLSLSISLSISVTASSNKNPALNPKLTTSQQSQKTSSTHVFVFTFCSNFSQPCAGQMFQPISTPQ